MTCQKCKYEFCWACLGSFQSYKHIDDWSCQIVRTLRYVINILLILSVLLKFQITSTIIYYFFVFLVTNVTFFSCLVIFLNERNNSHFDCVQYLFPTLVIMTIYYFRNQTFIHDSFALMQFELCCFVGFFMSILLVSVSLIIFIFSGSISLIVRSGWLIRLTLRISLWPLHIAY